MTKYGFGFFIAVLVGLLLIGPAVREHLTRKN